MRLLLYGSRDFAATVGELARHCGHEVVGRVDDYDTGPEIIGPFDRVLESHPPADYGFALAIGYNNLPARWAAWQRLRAAGYRLPPLIHPRAYVADSAHISEGAMVMAGAIVDVRVSIDEAAVLWPAVCVNHDAYIGANTFLSPSVTVCGHARIGAHSFIGAGSIIVDHGAVPEASFLSMQTRYTERHT